MHKHKPIHIGNQYIVIQRIELRSENWEGKEPEGFEWVGWALRGWSPPMALDPSSTSRTASARSHQPSDPKKTNQTDQRERERERERNRGCEEKRKYKPLEWRTELNIQFLRDSETICISKSGAVSKRRNAPLTIYIGGLKRRRMDVCLVDLPSFFFKKKFKNVI